MKKKIMIIEEDVIELNRLSLLLGFRGYEVCPLHRSYKVFTEITRCEPDIILLDAELSSMDSAVVSRALSTMNQTRDIPVVMIAVEQGEENITYCIRKKGHNLTRRGDLDVMLDDLGLAMAS
ncbi:hypothetical protein LLH06_14785 [Mucilaginibacter daejeonensis]|uniref:hypothetical protein n=1 Tax=Mucilaginibacter daejeonensis TaxID=398049 RepID=UPI001D174E20|nr:hypothetical protein [Mucilaginibacter daejeonensis]UEG52231.1 hypothetical protein LLH06_14785 [Mucilaginibacter daejeonensis]